MSSKTEFAEDIKTLSELLAEMDLPSMPQVGRKGYSFRLCDKNRRVLYHNHMQIHFAPAKLRDKDGDIVTVERDGHDYPIRCVPAALFNGTEDGDPYEDYRDEIAAFLKDVVPYGNWMSGICHYDPTDVADWDMAADWSAAKTRKWCKEHPYVLVWWQPANLVDNAADDLCDLVDFGFSAAAVATATADIEELV